MSSSETKPIIVFVNPASGTGIARKLFRKILRPALENDNLHYEHIETEYPGHAKDIMQNTQLQNVGGIVTISGDGLIHEIINGIYSLPNWEHILQTTPIGFLPGGSGNALNCSFLHQLGKPLDGRYKLGEEHSMANVCVGAKQSKNVAFDLIEVETRETKLLSFLGVTIGIVADVDIGSEIIRFLGFMRSYLLVAYKILASCVQYFC